MISRCNSPIPEITVCPVSSSTFTLNEGSSSASLFKAVHIFSWSAFDFGSTEIEITGSGNSIDSTKKISFTSQRVSQVFVFFNQTIAQIFQAGISWISNLLLACICKSLQTLSFSPVEAL